MRSRTILLLALLTLTLASAAQADVFTVVLNNGQTFDTRYYPVDAEWDEGYSMILSDQGNWIAIDKQDIAEVTSTVEAGGFGFRLDTSTIVVGWTYNEGDEDGSGSGQGDQGGAGGGNLGGDFGGVQGIQGQPGSDSYSIDQFVNTGSAGSTGGIPLEYTTYQ